MSLPRSRSAAFALASVLSLSGCGSFGLPPTTGSTSAPATSSAPPTGTATTTGAPTTPAASSPVTGGTTTAGQPDPSPSQTTASDAIARLESGNGSALPLMIPSSALPAGWSSTTARDTRGYRMTVCGVDLEPATPVDGAQQDWASSTAGLHLEQHVRVYSGDTATKVTSGLAAALPTCTSYTAQDSSGGKSTFTVSKLALKGAPAGVVAWRQKVDYPLPTGTATATATAAPKTVTVVQDVAVRRVGTAVVLLDSYGVGRNPDDSVLVTALKAVG